MARTVIALCGGLLPLLLLAGCQSASQAKLSAAAAAQATTAALAHSLPRALPASCTAHMGEAQPSDRVPWVVTMERWDALRADRNDQADACGAWWIDYRRRLMAAPEQENRSKP